MFEEVDFNRSTARNNACAKQCRIQKFMSGGTIFDGNCICDRPNQCWFNLQDKLPDVDPTVMFADVMDYYRQLYTE